MTKAIIDIAAPLGISVHDHIIVGNGAHASLNGVLSIQRNIKRGALVAPL